jgi:hypothetical protein
MAPTRTTLTVYSTSGKVRIRITQELKTSTMGVPQAGLTEPVGTGPETVGIGPTGPDRFRFPTGPNSKFEFKFKK